eukprot:2514327-Prymnesium_polylepis.1
MRPRLPAWSQHPIASRRRRRPATRPSEFDGLVGIFNLELGASKAKRRHPEQLFSVGSGAIGVASHKIRQGTLWRALTGDSAAEEAVARAEYALRGLWESLRLCFGTTSGFLQRTWMVRLRVSSELGGRCAGSVLSRAEGVSRQGARVDRLTTRYLIRSSPDSSDGCT